MTKKLLLSLLCSAFFFTVCCSDSNGEPSEPPGTITPPVDVIAELELWLSKGRPGKIENQKFAAEPLTAELAKEVTEMIYKEIRSERIEKYKKGWDESALQIGDKTMKIHYSVYGTKPADGRSLYISLHGGGNTTPDVNDGQWNNQKQLYKPAEGVYLCPRAAVDDWNMWFQEHCDEFYDAIILMAVEELEVNPDKIYIMGYSAGGDGVYRMAPRMADRWAAAAMMAGHPGDVSAVSLRNIGFTLWMGELDSAYDRNKTAVEFGKQLDSLKGVDPAGYFYDVNIVAGKPHWMDLVDKAAVPWMAKFRRNPLPERVSWRIGDDPHPSFYWLAADVEKLEKTQEVVVERKGDNFYIINNDLDSFEIALNDDMVNMDSVITVYDKNGEALYEAEVTRTVAAIYRSIDARADDRYIFSCYLKIKK